MAKETITQQTLSPEPDPPAEAPVVTPPEPEPPATRPRGEGAKSPTVEVDRELLEGILREVGELRGRAERIDQLEKDNAMLLEVADKGRIATYQSRNNPAGLIRTARLWTWKDNIVKATVTVRNEAFTDNIGRVHTDQVLNVIMEDGSEVEVPYDQFAKEKGLVEAEIIGRNTNEMSGQTFYKMKMKDGKEIEINYLFLN